MDKSASDARTTLRALTDDEMRDGLDACAWSTLRRHADGILVRRVNAAADDTLAAFGRQNRELAERRLAEGLPAYVKVEGVDGIVRQMPDGSRDLVEIVDGVMTVARRLPPVRDAGI